MIDCFHDKMLFQGAVNNVPQPKNPGLGILLGALQGAVGQLPSVYANVKAQGKGKGETSESEMPGQIRAQPPAVNNPRGQNRGLPPAVNNPRGQNRGLHASVNNLGGQSRGLLGPVNNLKSQNRGLPTSVNNLGGQNRGLPASVNNLGGQNRGLHASVNNPRVQNRGRPPPIWSGGLNRRVGRIYSRCFVFARAGHWGRAANQGVFQ